MILFSSLTNLSLSNSNNFDVSLIFELDQQQIIELTYHNQTFHLINISKYSIYKKRLFSKFRLGNLPILLQIGLTEDKSAEYPIIFNDLSMIIMIKSNKNINEYPKRIISRIESLVKKIVS